MSHRGKFAVIVVAFLSLPLLSHADFKIKTRSSVMGHSNESTVYVKGARERNESGEGSTTIMQCDKGRMIVLNDRNKSYMIMSMGEGGPRVGGGRAPAGVSDGAPRKGGTITITSDTTDTGERQQMFGYTARHLKSSVSMEASPDACSPANMHMESDGWYADLSPALSCSMGPTGMTSRMAGGRAGCIDRPIFKHTGSAKLGFPLKVTTTMQMAQGMSMTSTTEVVDLSQATLPDSLFDIPPGYHEIKIAGVTRDEESPSAEGAQAPPAPEQPAAGQQPPAQAAAPAPAAAPDKAAGALRIGVVRFDDQTNQAMPTDNLRDMMLGEFRMNHQFDVVPIDSITPEDIVNEARTKNCDYILTTTLAQLDDNPAAVLPASMAHTVTVTGSGPYLGRVDFLLTMVGLRLPQLKVSEAARADKLAVNAISDSIDKEVEAVVQEIKHPHKAAPAPSTTVKKAVRKSK